MYRIHPTTQKPFHNRLLTFLCVLSLTLVAGLLSACVPTQAPSQATYTITIDVDGKQNQRQVPAGTTVQMAVEKAGITFNPLDRLEPAGFTVLEPNGKIRIVRVREVFENQEVSIPFERQKVKNESLPETALGMRIQEGDNGVEQVTYRQVFENDQEISRSVFKSVILKKPIPEIEMIGVQKPFSAIPIPGRLVYMAAGNAWVMEKDTGNRRPLVTSADLDGHVFSLSPLGDWLLFTRQSTKPASEEINTLWMINLDDSTAKAISLRVSNIVNFAGWIPGKGLTVAYSTAEPRADSPGWQANNDLILTTYSTTGIILETQKIIEPNSGGVSGWWGTTYAISPDGAKLAYARPTEVGLVDLDKKTLVPLVKLTLYQTHANWAWVSNLAWAPNHRVLYLTTHAPKPGLSDQEISPLFDLTAVVLDSGATITLSPQSGMFSYPVASPSLADKSFHLAFLQSIFPDQSDTSRYRLVVMDRDGSNRQVVFPQEGLLGMDPQQVVWSRLPFPQSTNWIAAVYKGNLYLINPDSTSQQPQQITGDGLTKKIDW